MAFLAVIPVGAVFFLAYGRYDGAFRDNVVFLYFMGGLLMGAFLGIVTLFALNLGALIIVLILALFYPIALVAGVNRRKWQGERHAVFNGGAFGLGAALMLSFTLLFRAFPTLSVTVIAQGVLLSLGIATLFFGLGLLAGNAVRMKKQLRVALMGTAILLAPAVFLEEYMKGKAWLWLALLVAYGLIFAVAAERRLLIEGVEPEDRKSRRRRQRAKLAE